MKIIVDASVLIQFNRLHIDDYPLLLEYAKRKRVDLIVSTLTIFEYWSGNDLARKNKLIEAEKLFVSLISVDVDKYIAQKAGELYRNVKPSPQPVDLIIAATSIIHHAEVATYNVKHFKHIPEVKLFDWKRIQTK